MNPLLEEYKSALKLAIQEAAHNRPERIWINGSEITCNACSGYADAVHLLCDRGAMEMIEDTGKLLTARFT